MASIVKRERKDGSVAYQVKWRENGQWQSRTAPTPVAAKRLRAIIEATGTFTDDMAPLDVPTLDEQAEVYFTSGTRGNADTVREYRAIYRNHIQPAFGELAVTSLSVPLLATWGRAIPGSAKTRANITAVLSGILETAVPDLLPTNPWRRVRLEPRESPDERPFLEERHLALILREIPDHYRPLIATLSMTGLRWGEAAALSVGDLTVKGKAPVFRVAKAMKHRARQSDAPGSPKTKKSVRMVPAPAELLPVLSPLMGRGPDEPLFATVKGKRLRNSTFHTLVWQPALDRAQAHGLPFRPKIHELRAAATTWLLEEGMAPHEVADIMGHESIDTTMRIYRRKHPAAGKKASAAMSNVLGRVLRPQLED